MHGVADGCVLAADGEPGGDAAVRDFYDYGEYYDCMLAGDEWELYGEWIGGDCGGEFY
jgi:hypothetical protein